MSSSTSYDGWLPPLLSHEPHQAHTTIHISQSPPSQTHHRGDTDTRFGSYPELAVAFSANIYFTNKNKEQVDNNANDFVSSEESEEEEDDEYFEGLVIDECWESLCIPQQAIEDTLKRFPYLGSDQGGRVTWSEMHHRGEEISCELSSPNEFVDKFLSFMVKMMESGLIKYVIELEIEKVITIPEEDLRSWISWYESKKKSDFGFKYAFEAAISRPRTEEEVFSETVKPRNLSVMDLDGFEASEGEKVSANCCIFCMDKFSIGSKASKLPCTHVFHRHCLEKWLKDSKDCPVCRSHVFPADDVT